MQRRRRDITVAHGSRHWYLHKFERTRIEPTEQADGVKPRVERQRNPGTGSPAQPTQWAAGHNSRAAARATGRSARVPGRERAVAHCVGWAGAGYDRTQGSALARSTLGCMLASAPRTSTCVDTNGLIAGLLSNTPNVAEKSCTL